MVNHYCVALFTLSAEPLIGSEFHVFLKWSIHCASFAINLINTPYWQTYSIIFRSKLKDMNICLTGLRILHYYFISNQDIKYYICVYKSTKRIKWSSFSHCYINYYIDDTRRAKKTTQYTSVGREHINSEIQNQHRIMNVPNRVGLAIREEHSKFTQYWIRIYFHPVILPMVSFFPHISPSFICW